MTCPSEVLPESLQNMAWIENAAAAIRAGHHLEAIRAERTDNIRVAVLAGLAFAVYEGRAGVARELLSALPDYQREGVNLQDIGGALCAEVATRYLLGRHAQSIDVLRDVISEGMRDHQDGQGTLMFSSPSSIPRCWRFPPEQLAAVLVGLGSPYAGRHSWDEEAYRYELVAASVAGLEEELEVLLGWGQSNISESEHAFWARQTPSILTQSTMGLRYALPAQPQVNCIKQLLDAVKLNDGEMPWLFAHTVGSNIGQPQARQQVWAALSQQGQLYRCTCQLLEWSEAMTLTAADRAARCREYLETLREIYAVMTPSECELLEQQPRKSPEVSALVRTVASERVVATRQLNDSIPPHDDGLGL